MCDIVVRYARPEDLENRQELIRSCFFIDFWDAFLFFFFQELTLECCVLGAAVLFIFCGVSATACTMLLPVAAAFVGTGVLVYRQALAHKHMENISGELYGLVAEARGSLLPPKKGMLRISINLTSAQNRKEDYHVHVVGTVSVVEFRGASAGGWVEGLAVADEWRQRGIGAALVASTRQAAFVRGLQSLETVLTHLQPGARRLLHVAGWECRVSYERHLAGAALTLPVLRFGTDLLLA